MAPTGERKYCKQGGRIPGTHRGSAFATSWIGGKLPVFVALGLAGACGGEPSTDDPDDAPPLAVDGAVSSDTPEATRAGLDVLARGGNAVDAAVAVSLVLGVTEPSESGLGGSVAMLLVPAGGDGVWIDSPPSSADLPGALRVLHHAWQRFGSGRLTWEELVEPAIRAASEGYALGTFEHHTMVLEFDRIVDDPVAVRVLLAPDRSIPAEGTTVSNPELARVLEQIAVGGPDVFYGGALGRRMLHELAAGSNEAALAAEALASAPAAREVPALHWSYRKRDVWSAPEPYGGPSVRGALSFLALIPGAWLARDDWTRTAWTLEALAFSTSKGMLHPVERLAQLPPMPIPAGGGPRDAVLAADDATPSAPPAVLSADDHGGGVGVGAVAIPRDANGSLRNGSLGGTHFSVLDDQGNAVAVTQTLGRPYGSGLLETLGFFYQDAPSAERTRALVPTVVVRDGQVELVLGSAGGERGSDAVVQVLSRVIDLDQPLEDAVLAPRLHVASEEGRGRLFLEGMVWEDSVSVQDVPHRTWSASVGDLARARGFGSGEQPSGPWPTGMDPWFGGVNAVARRGGAWSAVGDERRGGFGGVLDQGAPTLAPADRPASELGAAPGG